MNKLEATILKEELQAIELAASKIPGRFVHVPVFNSGIDEVLKLSSDQLDQRAQKGWDETYGIQCQINKSLTRIELVLQSIEERAK